ncbi:MAG TPA: anthranilate/aminodeoxychorismate synthase component II [Lentisphaeria bacterium]|nr:MAG: anthranilate/aminodeoxychorismate synthase component II [Lentisphaerae bacterium GWF2_50_93]HCE43473.1 anthranilate/aminodeoxychorismate synthase component II [Lentisphaeria bacterium]
MFLMIDNYDSFTYNLVQYFGELGHLPEVVRNDKITMKELAKLPVEALVVSPGPCSPREAGISCDAIEFFSSKEIPVLGVCLGHQCIGEVFGGKIVHAPSLMHGKVSEIIHGGKGIFKGIPDKFTATRYHSLVIEPSSFPPELEATARTEDGVIMGLQHRKLPVYGVQFHPESILTEHGHKLLGNFLKLAGIR